MLNKYLSKRELCIIVVCCIVCIFVLAIPVYLIARAGSSKSISVTVEPLAVASVNFKQPSALPELTEEEFVVLYGARSNSSLTSVYETYEQFAAEQSSSNFSQVSVTAEGVNRDIYELANTYFNVYYGYMRVSPIIVLAISNVETPGRANNVITWSALFPSRYVSIDELYTFDVTSVVSNPEYFKVFSADYSTRDRGPLQMSPTYGTGNASVNALMSGTEKDKLAQVDTTNYASWVAGASSSPGDRFYIPDICLRMTGSFSGQISYIQNNDYKPVNDLQLVAMLAMGHHSSGVWTYKDHSKSVGCWRSGALAYEWSKLVSSDTLVTLLESEARTSSACFIDSARAIELAKAAGLESYDKFATKSIVCTYPIKVLYAYIKLCMLYTS